MSSSAVLKVVKKKAGGSLSPLTPSPLSPPSVYNVVEGAEPPSPLTLSLAHQ